MTKDAQKSNLISVQFLRAFAAISVVVFHAQGLAFTHAQKYGYGDAFLNYTDKLRLIGSSGVDLFFVISGFIMTCISWERFGGTGAVKNFYKKRLLRIVPIYWFYTTCLVLVLLLLPQIFQKRVFDLHQTIFSYLFLPAKTDPPYILEVAWTLSYEMYFYLLVGITLFFNRRYFVPLIGIFFLGSTLLGHFFTISNPILNILTDTLLWEFFMGMIIGVLYRQGAVSGKRTSTLLLVLGVALFIYWVGSDVPYIRWFVWGVPSALIAAGAIFWERSVGGFKANFLSKIGDSSYTLYLSHYLYLILYGKVFLWLGLHSIIGPDLFIIIGVLTAIATGYILYVVIEKPLGNLLGGVRYNSANNDASPIYTRIVKRFR